MNNLCSYSLVWQDTKWLNHEVFIAFSSTEVWNSVKNIPIQVLRQCVPRSRLTWVPIKYSEPRTNLILLFFYKSLPGQLDNSLLSTIHFQIKQRKCGRLVNIKYVSAWFLWCFVKLSNPDSNVKLFHFTASVFSNKTGHIYIMAPLHCKDTTFWKGKHHDSHIHFHLSFFCFIFILLLFLTNTKKKQICPLCPQMQASATVS